MWKPSCFLNILLVLASYQRATVLSRSIINGDSDTNGLKDFAGSASLWQDFNSINVTNISSGFTTNDQSEECHPCRCGVLRESLGIVGGKDTGGYKYPWMALIMHNDKFSCGGSLINNKYVMTAAHCVYDDVQVDNYSVQLMRYDTTADEEYIDLYVDKIIIHNDFNNNTAENDIALLRLDTYDLDDSQKSKMHSVCLPPEGKKFYGYNGIALGWGLTEEGDISDVLRQVSVPIISNQVCQLYYKRRRIIITKTHMCTNYKEGGKGACQGDSGGPLLVNENSKYYVVGVVSFGNVCRDPKSLGVYVRVNEYLDWLDENTMDACKCY